MIEIKHKSATFRVLPENAQKTHDLLALIDRTRGKRGIKFPSKKPDNRIERAMAKWVYPVFKPGMTTLEYIREYERVNSARRFSVWQYVCADRPAPGLDPSIPEVMEEIEPC